jgi:hypothetical protein
VERPVIDTVIQKTSGNALFSLGLIHQMIIVSCPLLTCLEQLCVNKLANTSEPPEAEVWDANRLLQQHPPSDFLAEAELINPGADPDGKLLPS